MKDTFLKPDNPLLYKIAKPVNKKDLKEKWFLDILEQMKSVAGVSQTKDENKRTMVGLAAPQVGQSVRLVFIDVSATKNRDRNKNKNIFMVNPEIISKSKKLVRGREGCYSAGLGICDVDGIVARHEKVKVKYTNLDGQELVEEFSGFTAVIIQHETDHLNGKVFVHRIKNEKDLHLVFPSETKNYRKNWKNWKRTMPPKIYFKEVAKVV